MIAGLRASTVTPGSTPPVVSETVPPICWALASPDVNSRPITTEATRAAHRLSRSDFC